MWLVDTLALARAVTAVVCALIAVYGVLAFRKTRRRSIFLLATGMGIASFGFLLEGALVEFSGWSLETATQIESVFTLLGFSTIAASLFVSDRTRTRARGGTPDAART